MTLLATPFHARAVAANRFNAWENRGGCTLAAHYGDVAEEALAARFGAALFDISWHWRVDISGDKADPFVGRLFTRDASALGIGAAMEVLWLNDGGAVRGQGMVVRLAGDRFRLTAASADPDWITDAARLYGASIEDRTRTQGALALIGPAAAKILKAAGLEPDIAPFSMRPVTWRGLDLTLSRLGPGYEIVCDADDGLIVWDRLFAAGRDFALLPGGLAALDIVETECGLLRPGRDYLPAREDFVADPTPQSLGLSALVDRAHLFNGRPGYLAAGPDSVLAGVLLESDASGPETALLQAGRPVGRTLASRYSPAMKQAIAFGVVAENLGPGILSAGGAACRRIRLPFLPIPAATETQGAPVEVLMRAVETREP